MRKKIEKRLDCARIEFLQALVVRLRIPERGRVENALDVERFGFRFGLVLGSKIAIAATFGRMSKRDGPRFSAGNLVRGNRVMRHLDASKRLILPLPHYDCITDFWNRVITPKRPKSYFSYDDCSFRRSKVF